MGSNAQHFSTKNPAWEFLSNAVVRSILLNHIPNEAGKGNEAGQGKESRRNTGAQRAEPGAVGTEIPETPYWVLWLSKPNPQVGNVVQQTLNTLLGHTQTFLSCTLETQICFEEIKMLTEVYTILTKMATF